MRALYRLRLMENYPRLNQDIYIIWMLRNFSFQHFSVQENTEEGFRNIIYEPSPGIFIFDMLPKFCAKLMREPQRNALVTCKI